MKIHGVELKLKDDFTFLLPDGLLTGVVTSHDNEYIQLENAELFANDGKTYVFEDINFAIAKLTGIGFLKR